MSIWKFLAKKCFALEGDEPDTAGNASAAETGKPTPQEEIRKHESCIRDIHDKLNAQLREIEQLENRIRELLKLYESASAAAKETYKIQLLSLKKELDGIRELRTLYERNLDKEKLILRKLKFNLEAAHTPDDTALIDDLTRETQDHVSDLELEDSYIDELEEIRYDGARKKKRHAARCEEASQNKTATDDDRAIDAALQELRRAYGGNDDEKKETQQENKTTSAKSKDTADKEVEDLKKQMEL